MFLKFILFLVLIGYLIYKVGGFIFRMLFIGATQQQAQQQAQRNQQQARQTRKPKSGNVNVDYVPGSNAKNDNGIKGGEYVDYEEVKD